MITSQGDVKVSASPLRALRLGGFNVRYASACRQDSLPSTSFRNRDINSTCELVKEVESAAR